MPLNHDPEHVERQVSLSMHASLTMWQVIQNRANRLQCFVCLVSGHTYN